MVEEKTTKKAVKPKTPAKAEAVVEEKEKTPVKETKTVKEEAPVEETTSEEETVASAANGGRGEYLYSVGKRKTSVAQIRVYKKGTGSIEVNGKAMEVFFNFADWQETIKSPMKIIGQDDKLDVTVKVSGGGVNSQAQAIRHGIAKALIQLNPNFRKPLKKAGFITRDARKKERKKPGLKRARRAPQWKKR